MALKATIYKVELQIADLDRHYYATHNLTVARHPSENEARMMLRLLAFARHADERLEFGRGVSTDGEPDLWRKSLSDEIELWIDLGAPDERELRQVCGRARQVILYSYNDRSVAVWWPAIQSSCRKLENLTVWHVDDAAIAALTEMSSRSMSLQFTLQEGEVLVTDGVRSVTIVPKARLSMTN